MTTRSDECKRIDVLTLTDVEKERIIKAAKEALRQQVEEAKFWRNLECS